MRNIIDYGSEGPSVVVDTLPGNEMHISCIERRNHENLNAYQTPHLLSSEHKRKMRELPY